QSRSTAGRSDLAQPRLSLRGRRSRPKQSRSAVATCPRGLGKRSANRGCHCEAGAAGRSNLVTLSRRCPEASGSALPALRDCFVALRAPRNDSRGLTLLAVTAVVLRSAAPYQGPGRLRLASSLLAMTAVSCGSSQ